LAGIYSVEILIHVEHARCLLHDYIFTPYNKLYTRKLWITVQQLTIGTVIKMFTKFNQSSRIIQQAHHAIMAAYILSERGLHIVIALSKLVFDPPFYIQRSLSVFFFTL